METIKIIVQRSIEPIKVIVSGFPKILPIIIRMTVYFRNEIKTIIYKRFFHTNQIRFNNIIATRKKSRTIITNSIKYIDNIVLKIKKRTTINNDVRFTSSCIGRNKKRTFVVPAVYFSSSIALRAIRYKKWSDIPNNLRWSDITDTTTMEEFCTITL